MRKIVCLIIAAITIGCGQSTADTDKKPANLHDLFSLPDAEKILGQPAHLADSSTTRKPGVSNYYCAYKANAEEQESRKTGAVYLLVQQYSGIPAAQARYSFIKTANENHGIKVLEGLGDEAYFHTDSENFYFIMVRKGSRLFNMKVNKITSATSLDEFNLVAKKITAAL